MGTMFFKSDKAFSYLMRNGFVYTFRTKRRRLNERVAVRRSKKEKKVATGRIVEIVKINDILELKKYVECSGFASFEEWVEEIKKLNGGVPAVGWLHKVELVEG